jgi:hypothetical protein
MHGDPWTRAQAPQETESQSGQGFSTAPYHRLTSTGRSTTVPGLVATGWLIDLSLVQSGRCSWRNPGSDSRGGHDLIVLTARAAGVSACAVCTFAAATDIRYADCSAGLWSGGC